MIESHFQTNCVNYFLCFHLARGVNAFRLPSLQEVERSTIDWAVSQTKKSPKTFDPLEVCLLAVIKNKTVNSLFTCPGTNVTCLDTNGNNLSVLFLANFSNCVKSLQYTRHSVKCDRCALINLISGR